MIVRIAIPGSDIARIEVDHEGPPDYGTALRVYDRADGPPLAGCVLPPEVRARLAVALMACGRPVGRVWGE